MNARKSLAMVAIAGALLSMTACSGDKTDDATYTNASPSPKSAVDAPTADAAPTSFSDAAAKAALNEFCSKVSATDVATLLGVPTVELRDGVYEAQDQNQKDKAYCSFMEPGADKYGSTGWDGSQTFANISVAGPAVRACEGCTGGTVNFPDSSTGYYGGGDETSLLVTPEGSAYEYSFSVVLPYEATTPGGLDRETSDLWQSKAADFAHLALG